MGEPAAHDNRRCDPVAPDTAPDREQGFETFWRQRSVTGTGYRPM
jgi:hypothetical protein